MYGLGTVYKKTRIRKDGGQRIFYVAQIRMTIDGETRRIEGQGKTPQAALHARERAVARALEGTTRTPQQPQRTGTLLALMTEWSATREVKSRTREHTESVIKNHIASTAIGGRMLRSIKSTDIAALLDSRETPWTKIAVYKALRSYMTYALRTGLITADPMRDIQKPKAPRAQHANSPAMDERATRLRGMLAWMRATGWNKEHPMYWARIMLALNGLRPGEARGLTWESIQDLNGKGIPRVVIDTQLGYTEGTLTLMPVKNDHPRTVVLRQQTIDALKAWKKVHTGLRRRKTWKPRKGFEDMVCVMNDGKPLRQQDDDKMWNALLDEAQKNYSKKIYWTMAYNRHIAVSLMRDAGVPASLVASIMGHTIAVEDAHYYQSQLSAQREAMATMDDYIVEHTTPKSEKA
jgi:integrase